MSTENPSNAELALMIQHLTDRFEDHMEAEAEERRQIGEKFDRFVRDAFADGDVHGHRKAHEVQIDAARAQAELMRKLRDKLAETGVFGTLRILGWLLLVGVGAALGAKLGIRL